MEDNNLLILNGQEIYKPYLKYVLKSQGVIDDSISNDDIDLSVDVNGILVIEIKD